MPPKAIYKPKTIWLEKIRSNSEQIEQVLKGPLKDLAGKKWVGIDTLHEIVNETKLVTESKLIAILATTKLVCEGRSKEPYKYGDYEVLYDSVRRDKNEYFAGPISDEEEKGSALSHHRYAIRRLESWETLNDHLKTSIQRGLVGVYWTSDPEGKARHQMAVIEAVRRARGKIWICGRTHSEMLVRPDFTDGWLLPELLAARSRVGSIKVILADGFAPADEQFKYNASDPQTEAENARHTIAGLIVKFGAANSEQVSQFPSSATSLAKFDIKAIATFPVPSDFLLADDTAFIEFHFPTILGGELDVYEYVYSNVPKSPYVNFETMYQELFRGLKRDKLIDSIENHVNQLKAQESNARRPRLLQYEQALGILKLIDSEDPD